MPHLDGISGIVLLFASKQIISEQSQWSRDLKNMIPK